MRALLIVIGVLLIGMAIWASLVFFPLSDQSGMVQADHIHIFSGVKGPSSISTVKPVFPTPVNRYSKGAASRLAILLTDPASNWLRLAHGLKTIGVPFSSPKITSKRSSIASCWSIRESRVAYFRWKLSKHWPHFHGTAAH